MRICHQTVDYHSYFARSIHVEYDTDIDMIGIFFFHGQLCPWINDLI